MAAIGRLHDAVIAARMLRRAFRKGKQARGRRRDGSRDRSRAACVWQPDPTAGHSQIRQTPPMDVPQTDVPGGVGHP
jgi:hypothetical protein